MTNPKNQTAQFYNIRGEKYLASSSHKYGSQRIPSFLNAPYKKTEKIIALKKSHPHQVFLDLCCGTGVHSIYPAKLGYQVFGNDISPQSIKAAIKLAKEHSVLSNCHFVVETVENFLNSQNKYDIIFISGSMYYFDPQKILTKIENMLKPGGHFIAIETNGSNLPLNIYRRILSLFMRHHRDSSALNNCVKIAELSTWKNYFDYSSITYFDFFTLLSPLFSFSNTLLNYWIRFAKKADAFVLKLSLVNYLSFKFLFIGRKNS